MHNHKFRAMEYLDLTVRMISHHIWNTCAPPLWFVLVQCKIDNHKIRRGHVQ